jgi:hydroxypyruvate reductase
MTLAATLLGAFQAAVRGIDLAGLVADVLAVDAPREASGVRVIAIGKAAPKMAEGALAAYGAAIEELLLIAPDDTVCSLTDPRVTLVRAAHPLPDERSVAASASAFELTGRLGAGEQLVVLVSGGASSLACAPHPAITREQKVKVIDALLASGSSIAELNTVRRHLSRIKGGGLAVAALARNARVLTLLASDVIDGGLEDIGSGPTVPDPTTAADAHAVLWRRTPAHAGIPLVETWKGGDATRWRAQIVLDPDGLAAAMAQKLTALGFRVRELRASRAAAAQLVAEYTHPATTLAPGEAIVRAAEPALAVDHAAGHGGRAGHLAALVARHLPPNVTFLAGASDGVDGSSGTAGAVVDVSAIAKAGAERWSDALARFDTGPLHLGLGTAIPGGPTGLNLCDVHVLARRA